MFLLKPLLPIIYLSFDRSFGLFGKRQVFLYKEIDFSEIKGGGQTMTCKGEGQSHNTGEQGG